MIAMLHSNNRFDRPFAEVPHPDVNPAAFGAFVSTHSRNVPLVWDPISKQMKSWMNQQELRAMYKISSASCNIL